MTTATNAGKLGAMTTDDDFTQLLTTLRPRLHRYCARMTGSAVDGEDVLQEALIKAVDAHPTAGAIDNIEGWLFRIAHNASLDFLRARSRHKVIPLTDAAESGADDPDPDVASISFRTFLELPVLQRSVVVLKDVLGYSIEEIAALVDCTTPAAKSALQRGRQRLKELNADGAATAHLPLLAEAERLQLQHYVSAFKTGDFDTIRQMLADDVRLDLVNRLTLQGQAVSPYFTRYAEATHWRFALGAVDGQPAMLVYDARGAMEKPAHFVVLEWVAGRIAGIKDFLFAPYAMEATDWVRLG
jgi:RNA polymerase sigma-70 factor (ECF subfamily)